MKNILKLLLIFSALIFLLPINDVIAEESVMEMVMTPFAFAQNLDMESEQTKQFTKMDSTLGQLTEKYQNNENVAEFILNSGIVSSNDSIRVIIELVDSTSDIPTNLGIQVETTYENFVQAMVPIQNLQAIASDENVKFVSLPTKPVPADSGISINDSDFSYSLIYLLIIPAIIIPVYYLKRKK